MTTARRADNLYEVLGVKENATREEIRAAYRKIAIKLHPDVNKAPDAKERFIECKTAYDTLVDSTQRAAYDRSRRGYSGSASPGIGTDFGRDWDAFTAYSRKAAQAATSYSFSDLERDLGSALDDWRKEREKQGRSTTVEGVLSDLGEELLQFFEMGIDDADSGRTAKGKPGATDSFDETLFGIGAARKQAQAATEAANQQAAAAAAAARAAARGADQDTQRKAAGTSGASGTGYGSQSAGARGAASGTSGASREAQRAAAEATARARAAGEAARAQAEAAAQRRAAEQRAAQQRSWKEQMEEKQRRQDAEIDNELEALKRKLRK